MVLPRLDMRDYLRIRTTMDDAILLHMPLEELADFCRRYQVRELALFGSMLRQEHRPESDVDLLVSFAPAARVTFLTLARMQRELEVLLGRKVDLVPKDSLKPIIREHILATARVLYAA
jgi:predicted nucleotidyltransferase